MKYLKNGKAVEVVSVLPDGQGFVVRESIQVIDLDTGEQSRELCDRLQVVKRVFDKAPTTVMDAEYEAAEQRLGNIVRKIADATLELRVVEQDRKAVLSKLQQMPALKRLEDWIDGKVTHFVTLSYGTVSVLTKDELKCASESNYRERRAPVRWKLITLFGDANGNLIWEANKYSDGSGSWSCECWMCCSEEEARVLAAQVIDRELLPERNYYRESLIKSADKIGHPIDPKHRNLANEEKRAELLKKFASRKQELDELEKQLLALNPPAAV